MKQIKDEYKSGILMPISSLPSIYGIGNFGKKAYEFADFLKETGQSYWQVLPLNPTSYGDSPYQSPATLAGNPYFIDPESLCKEKLITKEELKGAINKSKRIDYGWLFNTRYDLLRKAYARFKKNEDYEKFVLDNKYWLDDYALFMSLKAKNNYCAWINWDEKYRNRRILWLSTHIAGWQAGKACVANGSCAGSQMSCIFYRMSLSHNGSRRIS